jgi:hypothetical protein
MRHTVSVAAICVALLIAALWPRVVLSHETLTTTVLFDREIVRVLNTRCVMCHAEGGPSFPLETYEQAWLKRRAIRAKVLSRHMPPWTALPGYGQFANDNALTLRESQFVLSWVEGLGPRNAGRVFTNVVNTVGAAAPPIRARARYGERVLGPPSLALSLTSHTISPQDGKGVVRSVIASGLAAERFVTAVEFLPGDRRVVRAAFFRVQETGQWLGSWTPWYGASRLPAGSAYRLPAGAHIAAEIHYQSAEALVTERGTLGLFLADTPPSRVVRDVVLESKGTVPARAMAKRFRAETVLAADTSALAVWPVISDGLRTIELSARTPDGGTQVLLFARDISMDWPTPFVFKEPVRLRRGSVLVATAYYDNPTPEPLGRGLRMIVSTQASSSELKVRASSAR